MSDEINTVRHVLGIEPQGCETCRYKSKGVRGPHVYCMHPSSNWSRPLGGNPDPVNTKFAHNARSSTSGGHPWENQCGNEGKYWEPRDE